MAENNNPEIKVYKKKKENKKNKVEIKVKKRSKLNDKETIKKLIEDYGLKNQPADYILKGPKCNLYGVLGDKKLCWKYLNINFYHYGRKAGWKWTKNSRGTNKNKKLKMIIESPRNVGATSKYNTGKKVIIPFGKGLGDVGFGFISGNSISGNCGTFNRGVRQIAHLILGFDFTEIKSVTIPFDSSNFLTICKKGVIDPNWKGNVRMVNKDFNALGCIKFNNHSFNRYCADGTFWDASTNTLNFHQHSQYIWCVLKEVNMYFKIFQVTNCYSDKKFLNYYVISIGILRKYLKYFPRKLWGKFRKGVKKEFISSLLPTCPSNNEWSSWLLIKGDDLPTAVMKNIVKGKLPPFKPTNKK